MLQLDCRDLIVKARTSSPLNRKVLSRPSRESSLASVRQKQEATAVDNRKQRQKDKQRLPAWLQPRRLAWMLL